jgi:hypothetical protein
MDVSGQHHAAAALPLVENAGTHWIGGWVGPTVTLGLYKGEKNLLRKAGFEFRTFRPVA